MKESAWKHMRDLPTAVWVVSAATLINRMGAMVFPFLVLYFHKGLHMELERAAGIAAFYGIGSACACPIGGWLADRFDCAIVLRSSLLIGGSLLLLFPFIHGPSALVAATFGLALCADVSRPSTMTSLARLAGDQSRDAFALNYLAINLGMSIGPTLGGYLAVIDYRLLFWVDGGTSVLAGLWLWLSGIRCAAQRDRGPSPADWNVGIPGFRLLLCLFFSLWVFITFFAASPVYAVDVLHLPESRVGWLWLVNTVVIVMLSVWLNHRTRDRPLPVLLSIAALFFAGCYGCLVISGGLTALVVAVLLLTFGEMMLFSNASTYLKQVVPEHKLGRALALSAMSGSLANALATPAGGYFFTRFSPHTLWCLMALSGLAASLGFARLPAQAAADASSG